jgi:hypothetical protein
MRLAEFVSTFWAYSTSSLDFLLDPPLLIALLVAGLSLAIS